MSKGKPIPGFPGYSVTSAGAVYGPQGKLSPRKDPDGYDRVDIRVKGKRFTRFVHTLVEKTFGGNGKEVDHKNGNRTDNRASNLETVSHQENMNRVSDRHKKKK